MEKIGVFQVTIGSVYHRTNLNEFQIVDEIDWFQRQSKQCNRSLAYEENYFIDDGEKIHYEEYTIRYDQDNYMRLCIYTNLSNC